MVDKFDCLVRPIASEDMSQLLTWRNHPDIRKFMVTQHEITLDEHRAWFNNVLTDNKRCLLIVERAGQSMGYVQFSGITLEGTADWGFYVAPGSPKGSGHHLANAVLSYAFGPMSLRQIRGKALSFNKASIRLHMRCGFQEQVAREQITSDDGHIEEIVCFVLNRETWTEGEQKHG
jgi:UDP-4-amino-4,6-dideoxy-N-acetyl-beta-L-altrosamine N-acetyltransferase